VQPPTEMPDSQRWELRLIGFGGLALRLVASLVRGLEQPHGDVHREPSGQLWVRLFGLHPGFVNALRESRVAAATVFSPDGRWYWNGTRWVTNEFPEQWWRSFGSGGHAVRWWQVTLVVLLGCAAIGVLAWWGFHS
jgi:hypothetical protein